MFNLEAILSQDGFGEAKTAVGKAMAKHREQAQEKLADELVRVCGHTEETVHNHVVRLRTLRAQEKVLKAKVQELGLAQDYFKETGNPLPFYRLTGDTYSANVFCNNLGVAVPEVNDKLWSVPQNWRPTVEENTISEKNNENSNS